MTDDPVFRTHMVLHNLGADAAWVKHPKADSEEADQAAARFAAEEHYPPVAIVALTVEGLARLERLAESNDTH